MIARLIAPEIIDIGSLLTRTPFAMVAFRYDAITAETLGVTEALGDLEKLIRVIEAFWDNFKIPVEFSELVGNMGHLLFDVPFPSYGEPQAQSPEKQDEIRRVLLVDVGNQVPERTRLVGLFEAVVAFIIATTPDAKSTFVALEGIFDFIDFILDVTQDEIVIAELGHKLDHLNPFLVLFGFKQDCQSCVYLTVDVVFTPSETKHLPSCRGITRERFTFDSFFHPLSPTRKQNLGSHGHEPASW